MQGGVAATGRTFSAQRRVMVDCQIRTFDVTDQRVIRAFDIVQRERFLPERLRPLAYSDATLTLNAPATGKPLRTLLQPMHLARLLQGASPAPGSRVLVVAGEQGYGAALLAELAGSVVTLESDADLSAAAAANCPPGGTATVEAVTGDLAAGWAARAPYDVIVVQGSIETNLAGLLGQLAEGGRLVTVETSLPTLGRRTGRAMLYHAVDGEFSGRALFDASVPVLDAFRNAPAFTF